MGQTQTNIYGAKRGLGCAFALPLRSASISWTWGLRQKLRKIVSAQIPSYGINLKQRTVSMHAHMPCVFSIPCMFKMTQKNLFPTTQISRQPLSCKAAPCPPILPYSRKSKTLALCWAVIEFVQIRPGAEQTWNAFIWVKLPFLWRCLAVFRSNFRIQTLQFPHKNVFKHRLTAILLPWCRAGKSSRLMRIHYKVDNLPLPFKKTQQSFAPFSPHRLSSEAFPAAFKKPKISELQD